MMEVNANKRNESGFTLLELVIVIAIMLILMQTLFLSVEYFQEDQKESVVVDMNKSVNEALTSYYGTFGDFEIYTSQIRVGNSYHDVTELIANQMIVNLQGATAINIGKRYNHEDYKMNIDYVNKYVMKISFEIR